MKILAVSTNQQKTKTQNFGAFDTTSAKALNKMYKFYKNFFHISEVLQKGDDVVETSGFACIGQFFTKEQIGNYLEKHPNTYITTDDISDFFAFSSDLKKVMPNRLDEILKNVPSISEEGLDDALPGVINAELNLSAAKRMAKRKLGLDA